MLSLGALADVDEIAVRGTEEVVAAPVALPNLPKLLSSNLIEVHNFGPILESTFQGYSIWTYKMDRKADRKMAQKISWFLLASVVAVAAMRRTNAMARRASVEPS